MKTILILVALICIFGLSWVNLWFGLVGFILIGGLMCYSLFAYGMKCGAEQEKIMKGK